MNTLLLPRLYWISCNVVLVFIRRERGENLGKCLHPTATPHSESKKKELGSCIITSLLGPQIFHNWFLFTGKVNKIYINAKKPFTSLRNFFSDFRPSDLHHSKGLLKISVPYFFIETKLSRRDRHGSRRESGLLYWWISAGMKGGCQKSLRGEDSKVYE